MSPLFLLCCTLFVVIVVIVLVIVAIAGGTIFVVVVLTVLLLCTVRCLVLCAVVVIIFCHVSISPILNNVIKRQLLFNTTIVCEDKFYLYVVIKKISNSFRVQFIQLRPPGKNGSKVPFFSFFTCQTQAFIL